MVHTSDSLEAGGFKEGASFQAITLGSMLEPCRQRHIFRWTRPRVRFLIIKIQFGLNNTPSRPNTGRRPEIRAMRHKDIK